MATMMRLQATRPFRYGTRALQVGDFFEATSRDARLLLAIRKARAPRLPADIPPPPPEVAKKIQAAVAPPAGNDISAARAAYRKAFDKGPFMGWDSATLRKKIAEKAVG